MKKIIPPDALLFGVQGEELHRGTLMRDLLKCVLIFEDMLTDGCLPAIKAHLPSLFKLSSQRASYTRNTWQVISFE